MVTAMATVDAIYSPAPKDTGSAMATAAVTIIAPAAGQDSDRDGITDLDEINTYQTNPNTADSDRDGISDQWELTHSLNPLVKDSSTVSASGLTNLQLFQKEMGLPAIDSNGDGIYDALSTSAGLNPATLDWDGDGLTNAAEMANGTNPFRGDSDGDGVPDNLDAYPLDKNFSVPGGPLPTAPQIFLYLPVGATPLP